MASNIITTDQGEELRKQIGAAAYIECSSKTQQNVKSGVRHCDQGGSSTTEEKGKCQEAGSRSRGSAARSQALATNGGSAASEELEHLHPAGRSHPRYQIHELVGSGAYSDSDGLTVALKEVHDLFREIDDLQMLRGLPTSLRCTSTSGGRMRTQCWCLSSLGVISASDLDDNPSRGHMLYEDEDADGGNMQAFDSGTPRPWSFDIDQLGRIFNVLGNLTEASWLGCAKLPDFRTITFHRGGASSARASAAELLQHKYFNEEPLPVPVSELPVPLPKSSQDKDSSDDCNRYSDMDPDSDFDDFGPMKVMTANSGFSIQFP
ncbi:hypothetical protein MLD38_014348 [Melastoma candidum]|uniref:Uncharacterized protein n=1 Tax=Melastoma candidum TaxID=119954 RepID=A0ACB9RBV3_9MYRT|nr:hypothetical protein MLD38_014348 [Melastoma candidum]